MSYAEDREYSAVQKTALLTQYILEHGSITIPEAMEITGSSWRAVYRMLLQMDAVLNVYQEGRRRVYCGRRMTVEP